MCARTLLAVVYYLAVFVCGSVCVCYMCIYNGIRGVRFLALFLSFSARRLSFFSLRFLARRGERGDREKVYRGKVLYLFVCRCTCAYTHTHTHRAHHNGYSLRTVKIIYSAGEGRGQQEEFLLRPFVYIYVRARLPGYERCELASCTRREFYDALFRARRGNESQIC